MVDSGLDKSHEHLYKSKSTFLSTCIIHMSDLSLLFVFFSHSHRGCLCGEDVPSESLPEEPTTEEQWADDRCRVRHQERNDEGWRHG